MNKAEKILKTINPNTHTYRVLKHMIDYGSITPMEAIKEYGNTRLSASIYILKNDYGVAINTQAKTKENRYGKPTTFAEYVLDLSMLAK